jgi:CBS domain-containing protein
MRVSERLRRSAVGIGGEHTIKEAAAIMNVAGVGALAVIDGDAIVGIVTDRDLVRRAMAMAIPYDGRVDAVMTTDIVTVDADADLHTAFELFRTHAMRRLPVVREGAFIGMLTIDDLLIDVAEELASLAKPITAEVLFGHRDVSVPATT